ncbi:MAG: hypothetical protein ACKOZM_07870 [Flavobacteriales bacterium]
MKNLLYTLIILVAFNMASSAQTLNGTYVNGAGQKLIITNHVEGKTFTFAVKWGVKDEWGCIFEESGDAIHKDAQSAYYGEDAEWPTLSFKLEGKVISLEISPEYVGMDCARYGDSSSDKYTTFKKQ